MAAIANEPWSKLRTAIGLMLIGAGAVGILGNQGTGIIQPADPLTGISSRYVFWSVGAVFEVVGAACLFSRRSMWPVLVTVELTLGLLISRIGLWWLGTARIDPFFDTMERNFGLKAAALAGATYVCILFCLGAALLILKPRPLSFKMSCHACGGHIEFVKLCLGQERTCPHCGTAITLRMSEETLRTCCYFCQGPIEFYAHITGRRILCPHCRKEITLKVLKEIAPEERKA